ncbi:MAG TPA: hypothetical protein VF092_26050 [Longimicrobium sp.]
MRSPASSLHNVLGSILLVLPLNTIAFPGKLTSSWDMRILDEARTLAASFAAGRWGAAVATAGAS